MKSHLMMLSVVLLAALIAGCASMETSKELNGMELASNGKEIANVNAQTWGIYFLPMFPLITGDTSKTSGGIAFLADTSNIESIVDMATMKAKKVGATRVDDLVTDRTSFWIPPVFWYKSAQASGNAIK